MPPKIILQRVKEIELCLLIKQNIDTFNSNEHFRYEKAMYQIVRDINFNAVVTTYQLYLLRETDANN